MQCLPGNEIKAIITNSGEANAATGEEGEKTNFQMAQALANVLECSPQQILTASTGIIGKPLSIDKIIDSIPQLVKKSKNIAENFATAILTTDLVSKIAFAEIELSTGKVCITGVCKGSGMIHPNMATMLAYFMTDVIIDRDEAQTMLQQVCDNSFNIISVDGETSPNDCVFMMANGMSGVSLERQVDKEIFYRTLLQLANTLAKSIVRDGEGASKLIEVHVSGAETLLQARALAKSLITSPLVKTAIYGESPNWGRIISRIGNEGITETMINSCDIIIQGVTVFSHGKATDPETLSQLISKLNQDDHYWY